MGNNRGRPLAITRGKRDGSRSDQLCRIAKHKRPLPTSDQLAIDLDKDLRVEQRAVPHPPRAIDAVAVAQSIEAIRHSGVLFSRQRQCVDDPIHADRSEAEPRQLRVHEAYVKIGIMDDELRVADEGEKIVDHAREDRLVPENGGAMTVDTHCVLRDLALWIDECVKDLAGRALVHDLDGANFQHPMSVGRIEARRFRVEHDFTHGGFDLPPAPPLSA